MRGRNSIVVLLIVVVILFTRQAPVSAQFGGQLGGLSDSKIVAGLKDALQIGTSNAINLTGRVDGFFRNAAIKILLPKQLDTLAKGLRFAGQGQMVDEFTLSMNRAAEKAAPEARKIFVDAVKQMSFEDARKILFGNDTAATEYFKAKTSTRIATAFRPIIEKSMDEVGATRQYKEMIGRFQNLPFAKSQSLDIDRYVINKSLEGLFYMVGQEEKKIRKDPLARVTNVLKDVFGNRR
ncbi:MAG: DUF4197 domain-containing protein [Acidobacteriota bacterium]|nr:DUF4197 domain-containing protein [Acidobacteriota bacterium]